MKSLSVYLEELNECAERDFRTPYTANDKTFANAKIPPHLKRSINLAYLESGTNEEIVAHLEREPELSGLETEEEKSIITMIATTKKIDKLNHNCRTATNKLPISQKKQDLSS